MSLDEATLWALLLVFVRCSAMLLSAPLFGTAVPVQVRLLASGAVAVALLPVLHSQVGPIPQDLATMAMAVGREAAIGLIIGGLVQMLVLMVQMAGAVLDLQLGLSMAQLFSPATGVASTPVAQFKFMLGVVLLFLMDGHQMMIHAFVRSYDLPGGTLATLPQAMEAFGTLLGALSLLAIQIAAPVGAVTVILDVAAGVVNKAVPQSMPFLLSMPAKLMLGILVLALSLPAMVAAVQGGLDLTFAAMSRMLGGG